MAKRLGCKYKNITWAGLTVEDWLRAIKTAKYVITDSYHGICFAIIFNKPFLCINDIGQDRFASIFELFNINGNTVCSEDELCSINSIRNIDYEFVNKKLEAEKERAINFLKKMKI